MHKYQPHLKTPLQPAACRDIACREAAFLKRLQHPNIVDCQEVVNNGKQMVIIMEYLRGGQLFDQLENLAGEHYTEQQAAGLFVQVSVCMLHASL